MCAAVNDNNDLRDAIFGKLHNAGFWMQLASPTLLFSAVTRLEVVAASAKDQRNVLEWLQYLDCLRFLKTVHRNHVTYRVFASSWGHVVVVVKRSTGLVPHISEMVVYPSLFQFTEAVVAAAV